MPCERLLLRRVFSLTFARRDHSRSRRTSDALPSTSLDVLASFSSFHRSFNQQRLRLPKMTYERLSLSSALLFISAFHVNVVPDKMNCSSSEKTRLTSYFLIFEGEGLLPH